MMKIENKQRPLVSICVITYNSSKFILETLESVKSQSYKKIELIVTDDGSSDNTVELCKQWIVKNKECFKRTRIVSVEKNTGTVDNCIRGIKETHGEWIKIIAGDDCLTPDCISLYVNFVETHAGCKFVMADSIYFTDKISDHHYRNCYTEYRHVALNSRISAKKQFNIFSKILVGTGPCYLINKQAYDDVGGFDRRFPLQEDWAFFIKMAKAGYKMYYLPAFTVLYRVHESSVSHSKTKNKYFSKNAIRVIQEYKRIYQYENLNNIWKFYLKFDIWLENRVIESGNDRCKLLCRVRYTERRLLSPFLWYSRYLKLKDKAIEYILGDKAF